MNSWWRHIYEYLTKPDFRDSAGYIQGVKIKILNQQIFIVGVLVTFFTLQAFLKGDSDWMTSASILVLSVILHRLNNWGYFAVTRFIWMVFFPVLVLGMTYLYGEALGGEFAYLAFIVAALVFYGNNWMRVGQIALIIILFLLTNYFYDYVESPFAEYIYPSNRTLMFIVSVVCASIAMITFFNETLKHYESQENLGNVLKDQNAYLTQLVDEKRAAYENLRVSKQELQKSNEQLLQYSYIASHDLKTPIRNVSSFVDLLSLRLKGQKNEEIQEYLGFIKAGTQKMYQQVEALLETSRYQHLELDLQIVDIIKLLEQVEKNLTLSTFSEGAIIRYGHIPTIIGDPLQLERLFQNLLENGLKYNNSPLPEVRVGYEARDGFHQFSVSDNGIGIAPEFYDTVFQVFKRLHQPDQYSGNGIGLANCKHIVELHGGAIWIDPRMQQGTTFRFTIPLVRPDRSDYPGSG